VQFKFRAHQRRLLERRGIVADNVVPLAVLGGLVAPVPRLDHVPRRLIGVEIRRLVEARLQRRTLPQLHAELFVVGQRRRRGGRVCARVRGRKGREVRRRDDDGEAAPAAARSGGHDVGDVGDDDDDAGDSGESSGVKSGRRTPRAGAACATDT